MNDASEKLTVDAVVVDMRRRPHALRAKEGESAC
jgi:hypothetical protein